MIIAIVTILIAVGLLYFSWKGKLPGLPAKLGGWGMVVVSSIASIYAWGPEFGPVYVLSFLACAAALFVIIEAEPWVSKITPVRNSLPALSIPAAAKQTLFFLFVFIIGGLASMCTAIVIGLALPGELVDRMAAGVILTPVLWGGAMYWTTAHWSSARVGLTSILFATGLMLYL